MKFFDSGKTAEILRKSLIKNDKFLVAKIEGSKQEQGTKKVLDKYCCQILLDK